MLGTFLLEWLAAWRRLFSAPDPMRYALPERERGPWAKPQTTRPKTDGVQLPDNMRSIPGTHLVVKDTELRADNGQRIVETEVVTPGTEGRVKHLTEADRAELGAARLDAVKGALVKPWWAQGYSTRDASAQIVKSQKSAGYKERSLDPYWAAFNRAAIQKPLTKAGEGPLPYEMEW